MITRRSIQTASVLLLALVAFVICNESVAQNAKHSGPLKVFILAGQSNMQGHAHVSTIDAMRLNPQAAPLLEEILSADGSPIICQNVWISSIGSSREEKTGRLTVGFGAEGRGPKIGPEYSFGIYAHRLLREPILIIKTAWGGKSLNTDFRPPSAGPYEFNQEQLENFRRQEKDIEQLKRERAEATGKYYRLMIDHIQSVLSDIDRVYPEYQPDKGYKLAGFVWFQGWNDMVDRGTYPERGQPGGYDEYSELLVHFINDIRRDLSASNLPFVIGVMGVGGPTNEYGPDQQRYERIHQNFRDAMAAPASLPELEDSVVAVLTEEFWDRQVVALRQREKEIKPRLNAIQEKRKQGQLSPDAAKAQIEKVYAETFDEQELEILQKSTSNFDFHYMGSAGIMTQIGKAFAEAMVNLIRK